MVSPPLLCEKQQYLVVRVEVVYNPHLLGSKCVRASDHNRSCALCKKTLQCCNHGRESVHHPNRKAYIGFAARTNHLNVKLVSLFLLCCLQKLKLSSFNGIKNRENSTHFQQFYDQFSNLMQLFITRAAELVIYIFMISELAVCIHAHTNYKILL